MRLTTSPPSCANVTKIWESKPPGTLWATPGLLRDCFIFAGFEQVYCSSSGVITLYIQQLVCVMRICWLAVGRIVVELLAASQRKRMTYANCCIYRKVTPDDEQ